VIFITLVPTQYQSLLALDLGYKNQLAGSTQPYENSVLIASKSIFEVIDHSRRISSVRFEDFVLFGVYFPQGEERHPIYHQLKKEVKEAGESCLAIGDFNTGLHYLDEAGASFICADSFESLKDDGLVDSWRSRNPTAKEFSWYSSQGNGFRIDHAFCSPLMDQKVSNIRYIHSPRELKITDHRSLCSRNRAFKLVFPDGNYCFLTKNANPVLAQS